MEDWEYEDEDCCAVTGGRYSRQDFVCPGCSSVWRWVGDGWEEIV